MKEKDYKYIYGPVFSWRLGVSLGIDLLASDRKVCSFDCIYCQLGSISKYTTKPQVYVKTSEVIAELKRLPKVKVDYVTFSGSGDPSLAGNLGQVIKAVKNLKIAPVAVLTNAALLSNSRVRKNLHCADFIIAKLDAFSQQSFERINRPAKPLRFKTILAGIRNFRKNFKGRFALQMMFVNENKRDVLKLLELAREINPDQVQINTPLRPCKASPVSSKEISRIKECFSGINVICVYDVSPRKVTAFSKEETLRRRKAYSA